MARVSNTATNGIIDSILISRIVAELNKINDWLGELGYEQQNQGMLYKANKTLKDDERVWDIRGADDFKVFSMQKEIKLKNSTNHGDVSISGIQGHQLHSVVASVECSSIPVLASIKSANNSSIVVHVRTLEKATANTKATLHVIAIAEESGTKKDY